MRILAEYCLPLVRVGGLFVAAKGHDPQFPKWHVELTSVFDIYLQEEVRNAERAVQLMGASLLQLCSDILEKLNNGNQESLLLPFALSSSDSLLVLVSMLIFI
ncbi:hypothetical protein LWI29_025162 [Acer saccharum]|uniref:Uncharacterized protein n=1 Tax=Acer saccharum TaxID=4024 RepID=A0AA39VWT9_ACESA|nr:hypothetical protein LWI29_025162 [Acer saccharum]